MLKERVISQSSKIVLVKGLIGRGLIRNVLRAGACNASSGDAEAGRLL